jgi:hypothetical protein
MKKPKEETRRYEAAMLALPPLKMTLVDTDAIRAENEKKTRALRKLAKSAQNKRTVEKLIDHLMKMDK